MTKYQCYAEYKDSGVEWLGDIPSHWTATALKRYARITDGSHHSPKIENEGFPFVSVTDVGINNINFVDAKKITKNDYLRLVKEGCKPAVNDVLLTKDGTIGRACIVTEDMPAFVILSSLGLITPNTKISSYFLYYYLVSGINVDQMNSVIHGSALKRMTINKINDLIFTFPDFYEQEKIANFLDYETAKIDSLISKQEKLIELLKEKRQAVISHAVTKGLNPDVAMKDSGVEWLGEIPSHWGTVFLKMVIDVRDGTHETPAYVEPTINSYPLVTSKDVTGGWVDLSECKHISKSDYRSIIKRSNVAKGDILMPMIGTVGSPVIVKDELEIAIKNLALFRTSDENLKIYNKFLYYFLNSEECNIQFILEGRGGVQNFVSLGTLRNLRLPYLSLNEQTEIADFLDHETTKIDHLINKVKQQIQLMQERRTALISAAVTGKIDVRNWQNPTEAKMEFSA